MDCKELWQECYERLEETLGREPRHDEVNEEVLTYFDHLRDCQKYNERM